MPNTLDSDGAQAAPTAATAHRQLSVMIDAGRAFSGNERNCAFLNTRDGRFATVSAGAGIDFPDDGRAVALSDWDHDGDVDVWVSNRNAPRLRMLRNTGGAARWVALRLVGDGVAHNRDAIGARVEVEVRDGSAPLVRTLRAGDGFLSQSSKWLHFGLGADGEIERTVVRWPDGEEQVVEGIVPGRRYRVTRGERAAEPELERERDALVLAPREQTSAPEGGAARIPAITLVKGPRLNLRRSDGSGQLAGGDRALLINLWATWCAPCLTELATLRDRAHDLREAGIDVIALNVDRVGAEGDGAGSQADPAAVVERLQVAFPWAPADERLVGVLQDIHNSLVGLNHPLPLPTSFLADAQGRVAVIYKGPVEPGQLIDDLAHSDKTLDQRMLAASPLGGSLVPHPLVRQGARTHEATLHLRFGKALEAIPDLDAAAYHYETAAELDGRAAEARRSLAQVHIARQDWAAAAQALRQALQIDPRGPDHRKLAQVLQQAGDPDGARQQFETALQLQPEEPLARFGLAALLAARGDHPAAARHYKEGLVHQPGNHLAANNLAWLLATSPNPSVRNPTEALQRAQQLNQATGGSIPNILDTLAAAQAAAGQFATAAETAQRAITLAEQSQHHALADGLRSRLTLYRSGSDYTEPPQK